MRHGRLLFGAILLAGTSCRTIVFTRDVNNSRTGVYQEAVLTPEMVASPRFGKLDWIHVDGFVFAQPLYADRVGPEKKRALFVATEENWVYAFDVGSLPAQRMWAHGPDVFGAPRPNDYCNPDQMPTMGVTSTPVIDSSTETLYLVSKTLEPDGKINDYLWALDLATGEKKLGSPIQIRASVPGEAEGGKDRVVTFDAKDQLNRAALLLWNGTILVAYGNQCDHGLYHGWIFGYDAATLTQTTALNLSPNGHRVGVWQAGRGLAADANSVYLMTGNEAIHVPTRGQDESSLGNSFLRIISTAGKLTVDQRYTPKLEFVHDQWSTLWDCKDVTGEYQTRDLDLGSSGPLLYTSPSGRHLILGGGKAGLVYVLDRDSLGNGVDNTCEITDNNKPWSPLTPPEGCVDVKALSVTCPGSKPLLQVFRAGVGHIHGSPVLWESSSGTFLYVWTEEDKLRSFPMAADGRFDEKHSLESMIEAPANSMPGGFLSVSSDGANPSTGILWATVPKTDDALPKTVEGVLYAFRASDVRVQLWNSEKNPGRDGLGMLAKANPPLIVGGRVYVATASNAVAVYGFRDEPKPATCELPSKTCAGACINPQTNPNHCGTCERKCGDGAQCRAGVCVPAPAQCSCTSKKPKCCQGVGGCYFLNEACPHPVP